ncbi:MAG: histidine phosphatase family protein, partial [Actinomycetota bacterium]
VLVGAETDEQVLERFSGALRQIEARHSEGGRVLIVSHGGAMRAYLRDRFGPEVLPADQRAANASITRLALGPDGRTKLVELASTAHLSPADETYPTSE